MEVQYAGVKFGVKEILKLETDFFSLFFFFLDAQWHMEFLDQIQVTVATYAVAAAKLDPLTNCARPEVESVSWCCRDAADPVVPYWELLVKDFN